MPSTQTRTVGKIRSMSLLSRSTTDCDECLIGCSTGQVVCGSLSDTSITLENIQEGHTAPLTALAFDTSTMDFNNPSANHFFVTGTRAGNLRAWDIIDYRCVGYSSTPKHGSVLVLKFLDSNKVIVGSEDGSIRCMDFPALQTTHWYIATAHRDGTNCIGIAQNRGVMYMVSGGNDSTVRVWKLSNRELVTQHSDHKKAVTKVMVDCQSPSIIHSCGLDGQLVSFDLKSNKRICIHMINSGSLMDMTQRTDSKSEIEVVTCDSTVSPASCFVWATGLCLILCLCLCFCFCLYRESYCSGTLMCERLCMPSKTPLANACVAVAFLLPAATWPSLGTTHT